MKYFALFGLHMASDGLLWSLEGGGGTLEPPNLEATPPLPQAKCNFKHDT